MSNTHGASPTACDVVTEALGGRYEILSELGEGSFGTVYKAKDKTLNRIVAVKSVRLDSSTDPAIREDLNKRFLREAQVAAQLNHPNIVTIHDIISTPSASLIVMEFVEGVSLRSVLSAKKRLRLQETFDILSQVAEALDYAHENKVIHRDVKPANIMIMPSNEVRVTDFGIAKTESSSELTLAGAILGTPDYMSPEQARGMVVDGRSDLFSLGSVFYECLTGDKPFRGATVTSVLLRIVSDDPAPEVDWADLGLPPALDNVIQRALAKDLSERYPTGAALNEAVRSLLLSEESGDSGTADAADEEPPAEVSHEERISPKDIEDADTTGSSYIEALRSEERVLNFSTEDPNTLQSLDLSPDEAYIVSRIDGTLRPRDVFAVSPLNENETARTILGLIEVGIIKFVEKDSPSRTDSKAQPAKSQNVVDSAKNEISATDEVTPTKSKPSPSTPAKAPTSEPYTDPSVTTAIKEIERIHDLARFQDHAQFLGISKNAGRDAIQRAFQEKSALYNPFKYPDIDDPAFHDKLRHLLRLTYEAYTALSKGAVKDRAPGQESQDSPEARPDDETSAAPKISKPDVGRESAEELYIRAKKAHENEDYWMTIELCRHAISISDQEAKYHHLLGLALLQNDNWRKEAAESIQRATELDPDNPEYFEILGSLYQQAGLSSRAQKMFERAKSKSN